MIIRYAYAAGWLLLACMLALLIAGFVRNPVNAKRQQFERQLADATPEEIDIDLSVDPKFEAWQQSISARAKLWGPLVPPPKVDAPPPALQQMLAGVEPTRNTMGSGPTTRIQVRVDGKKDWFGVGQQVKGCTIEEITPTDVLFTVVQDNVKHGIRLERK